MYTYEQRMKAVELYKQNGFRAEAVIQELGYPQCRQSVRLWYKEYKRNGRLHNEFSEACPRYTEAEKHSAVRHYLESGRSITKTINALGYPSRQVLRGWIKEEAPESLHPCNASRPVVYLSQSQKELAVAAFITRTCSAKEIAKEYGVSREILYRWRKRLCQEEFSPMPKKKLPRNREEAESQIAQLKEEVAQLAKQAADLEGQVHKLKLEKCILEKAAEVLKKDQGISITTLTNREKAIVINALRGQFQLKELLRSIQIAKSSYCYQAIALSTDRYKELRETIHNAFDDAHGRYGYRRIHAVITAQGRTVSEKVVRRLMKEESLKVRKAAHRRYCSYQGEISPEVENIIKRDFHADQPNKKWLTDITEFHIPAGKIYLSPIIDCFDGLPVSWTIGTSPSADLVNSMLDEAVSALAEGERPIIHSDRGAHYRWPGWIERMEAAGLTRSMSKKGCSPDNSACEGFFGRLKNEMFYGVSWRGVSIDEFISELDRYIHWYAEKRIKISLGGMSPIDYRRSLGLIAS